MNKSILFLGPAYKNHRGGIGAVIAAHVKLFPNSKFYCSFRPIFFWISMLYSVKQLLFFPMYLLFNWKIKVIHIHGASRGSFFRKYMYFFIAKYLFNKKVIYHIHGGEFHVFINETNKYVKKKIRRIMEGSDQVIVLSNRWLSFFEKHYPKSRIIRIYNPIELVNYDARKKSDDIIRFLFLGHISANKGCYNLLTAAEKIAKKYTNFLIKIGGNGETEKLIYLIDKKKLGDYVEFLGWVSGDNKKQILLDSDVYVLPSLNEGLPVSILEAMSVAMPIISTTVGGIPEMIENKKSGFLIAPENVEKLEKSMIFFIENNNKIREMGDYSRVIAENKFSAVIIKEQLINVYRDLLKYN